MDRRYARQRPACVNRREDEPEEDIVLARIALTAESLAGQPVTEVVDKRVGNRPRMAGRKACRVRPEIGSRCIWKSGNSPDHILLVVAAKGENVFLAQIVIELDSVRVPPQWSRSIETESARVQSVP